MKTAQEGFLVSVYGPRLARGLYPLVKRPSPSFQPKLLSGFRKAFLGSEDKRLSIELNLGPEMPALSIFIDRGLMTAASIILARSVQKRERQIVKANVQALGLLLSGVDHHADDRLIAGAMGFIAETKLPLSIEQFDQIARDKRPLAVIIFKDGYARQDPSLHLTFISAAQVFFQQFGVEGDQADLEDAPPYL